MKQIITVLFATGLLAALFTGCKEEYKTYSDREFVMFADTAATYMVLQDKEYFSVPVTSTVACDYDRTFGVEIIDKGSNAIEGLHYALRSNTITIKAGQRAANVEVRGLYDNIEPTDSLGFILKLVMPEQVNWNLYHDQTKVVMMKSCPYDVNDFTGWCVVTSLFLNQYPGIENTSLQRLIRTEKHPTEENMIILHDWLFSGYDVTIRLDPADPAEPLVTMDKNQILADEGSVFGQNPRRQQDSGHQQPALRLLLQFVSEIRHALDQGPRREHGRERRSGGPLLQHHRVGQRRRGRPAPA